MTRRCTRSAAFVLVWALLAGAARAGDVAETTRAVERAVAEGDDEALAALVEAGDPDPWLVASALCGAGALDAAARFAKSGADRVDTAGLLPYVETMRARGADPVSRILEAFDAAAEQQQQGAFDSEAETLREAAKAAEQIGWVRRASSAWFRAGTAARKAGSFDLAAEAWGRRVEIEQRRGNALAIARARSNLGSLEAILGNYPAALDHYRSSLEGFRAAAEEQEVLRTLLNVGLIHERRGRYREALPVLDAALDMTAAPSPARATVLLQYGGLSTQLGETDRARAQIEEARGLFAAAKDDMAVVGCLAQLAALEFVTLDFERMRALCEESLAALAAISGDSWQHRWHEAAGLTNHGLATVYLGRAQEGLGSLLRALELAESLRDPALLAATKVNAARGLLETGALDRAESLYASARTLADDHDLQSMRIRSAWGLAMTRLRSGALEAAMSDATEALDLLVVHASGLGEGQDAEARSVHSEYVRIAVEIAARREDPAALFDVLERARATAFLTTLTGRDTLRAALLDERLRAEEDRLRGRVERTAALLTQTDSTQRGPLRTSRRKALEEARGDLRAGLARIQREAKRDALLYPSFVTLSEFQALLAPEDVLVAYARVRDGLIALVVQRGSARIVRLDPPAELEEAARSFVDPHSDSSKAAESLAATLVKPLGIGAGARLMIVPDDALYAVPFARLAPDHEIIYVPSGSVYALLTRQRSQVGQGVLGLGDPIYEPVRRLRPLTATRAEIEAVADVTLLGPRATLAALTSALGQHPTWRAIHLACHGTYDPLHPLQSGLELTDGRLDASRIFTLRWNAELVVLSACETGLGAYFPAEGLVGLTRAVLFAGTPRALCSLWRVDDQATKALMVKFHELWNPRAQPGDPERAQRVEGPGLPTAEALRRAQDFVREQPGWQHPYYWAGWTLWGLGR